MVGGHSMGPGLQLFGAQFLNFLLGKLSREFKLRNSNGHISVVHDATVTWLGVPVVLQVLCMLT